jgi:RNA polymerase sigma factor (TIGR02999 family)
MALQIETSPSFLEHGAPHSSVGANHAGKATGLFSGVYKQLKSMARRELGRSGDRTLNTTGLVHELYVRVCAHRDIEFPGAAQFFSYAGRAMRHILIDRACRRIRPKCGGAAVHVDLTHASVATVAVDHMAALQLDAALSALECRDARAAQVVELHYFAGLDFDQVATLVGVSRRTIDRDWRYARAFLRAQIA